MATKAEMDALDLRRFVEAQEDHIARGGKRFIQRLRGRGKPTDRNDEGPSEEAVFNSAHEDLEFPEYKGPYGIGYLIVLNATEGQKKFRKTYNHGPEVGMAHGWIEVSEEE